VPNVSIYDEGPGHPSGCPGPVCTLYALASPRATAARHGLQDLDLFAGTGVLDKVPDVDDAFVAGVRALEASVMRLYGVVVILIGWVRVGCARLLCGHEAYPFVVQASGSGCSCGASFMLQDYCLIFELKMQ